ncbi:hypothetical protein DCCM_0662 [Desulfocucumis palustris]|uniref:Uncharacterized protein n=1 Tax=Desulfocucumis palustris TaxID=1898651 RepID=A0A2L2XE05_9FIRM|nr:hypothetical protein [Desulfocucumis palustris]GBF32466.1 hypothetical protein DCCM_0662 [Desulfocucumis palustris]
MKIVKISYPTPLSDVKDIENDNIDVFIEMEDRMTYTVVVATPKNILLQMDNEGLDYLPAGPPCIFVKKLTEENIANAIKTYVKDDAYWLKLYFLAGEREGVFSTSAMNDMLKLIKKVNDDISTQE